MMIASLGGADIGTVLVGWEVDPLAEAALDAARRAGLYVVVVDDGALGDFGALADERVDADRPLADVVLGLQKHGRVVLTVVLVPGSTASAGRRMSAYRRDLLAGLLRSDVAVSLTDERSAVVWGADVLPQGLEGVWRLLAAVPAARAVGRHSKVFAEAGAALSGLLVVTRGSRPNRGAFPVKFRLSPVNIAAAVSSAPAGEPHCSSPHAARHIRGHECRGTPCSPERRCPVSEPPGMPASPPRRPPGLPSVGPRATRRGIRSSPRCAWRPA